MGGTTPRRVHTAWALRAPWRRWTLRRMPTGTITPREHNEVHQKPNSPSSSSAAEAPAAARAPTDIPFHWESQDPRFPYCRPRAGGFARGLHCKYSGGAPPIKAPGHRTQCGRELGLGWGWGLWQGGPQRPNTHSCCCSRRHAAVGVE